jgi:hypothetical protein
MQIRRPAFVLQHTAILRLLSVFEDTTSLVCGMLLYLSNSFCLLLQSNKLLMIALVLCFAFYMAVGGHLQIHEGKHLYLRMIK